ncbi:MAG: hypothetical protein AAFW75_07125 [Cyanobacteria bacterium J06636_16]
MPETDEPYRRHRLFFVAIVLLKPPEIVMTGFEGTFKPPVVGSYAAPIKITGPGHCDVTSDGLVIKGFQQRSAIDSTLFLVLFLILFFGLVILSTLIGTLMDIAVPIWLISIPISGFVFAFTRGQGTDHEGENIELFIPWECIAHAALDTSSGAVNIRVRKFRHQDQAYKGILFFHPSAGSDALLNALQKHTATPQLSNEL